MIDDLSALPDRRLDTKTLISLRREPACFAHLSSYSATPPLPIESLQIDFASADCVESRPSVWAVLEMRSALLEGPTALLGFDETFLRPFSRALIETAGTRQPYRMNIARARTNRPAAATAISPLLAKGGFALHGRAHVIDYVRGPGTPLSDLILSPYEDLILVSTSHKPQPETPGDTTNPDTLFQLPRTDSFLRAFVKIAFEADRTLRDTLTAMETIERRRRSAAGDADRN